MVSVPESPLTQELATIQGVRLDSETRFADMTTLRLGGKPELAVRCQTQEAIVAVCSLLDDRSHPYLVVGGGSNLVVADSDQPLIAVVLENTDVTFNDDGLVRAGAGAVWDDVVAAAVERGFGGIECLSGIPGSAGATPVQNVGAYGAEISEVLTRVLLYERATGEVSWRPAADLDLAYRYSNLKFTSRAVVLEIEMQLSTDGLSTPLRFGQLSGEAGSRRGVAEVREDVLRLRRGKGMVLDAADHDTWSAGSFFTNPVVPSSVADAIQEKIAARGDGDDASRMPRFDAEGGEKLSAAWLIERAGFPRGYPAAEAPARLSTKHTLALTNRGNATAADLMALARDVRDGVLAEFGVELVPEPVWIGAQI